jgi:hypothetical protein
MSGEDEVKRLSAETRGDETKPKMKENESEVNGKLAC